MLGRLDVWGIVFKARLCIVLDVIHLIDLVYNAQRNQQTSEEDKNETIVESALLFRPKFEERTSVEVPGAP